MAKEYITKIRDEVIRLKGLKMNFKSEDLTQMFSLMDIHRGHELYSPVYGKVVLTDIDYENKTITVKNQNNQFFKFSHEGKLYEDGEVVLFPDAQKIWKPIPLPTTPPDKKKFDLSKDYHPFKTIKLLEFLLTVANEINSFFDRIIEDGRYSNRRYNDNKELEKVYTIELIKKGQFEDYDRTIELKTYEIHSYQNDRLYSPFVCFNSYSALLYFLATYKHELDVFISFFFFDMHIPVSIHHVYHSSSIKANIDRMFSQD